MSISPSAILNSNTAPDPTARVIEVNDTSLIERPLTVGITIKRGTALIWTDVQWTWMSVSCPLAASIKEKINCVGVD